MFGEYFEKRFGDGVAVPDRKRIANAADDLQIARPHIAEPQARRTERLAKAFEQQQVRRQDAATCFDERGLIGKIGEALIDDNRSAGLLDGERHDLGGGNGSAGGIVGVDDDDKRRPFGRSLKFRDIDSSFVGIGGGVRPNADIFAEAWRRDQRVQPAINPLEPRIDLRQAVEQHHLVRWAFEVTRELFVEDAL